MLGTSARSRAGDGRPGDLHRPGALPISGLIDRAAQRGLVTRTADPHDGRSVRVALTDSARDLIPEITAAIADRISPLTGRLSTVEQKQLTALLTKALGSPDA